MLQEGSKEFLESEMIHERLGDSSSHEELPESIESPMLTPSTEESTQNIEPQVISNFNDSLIPTTSNEPPIPDESLVSRYPQRSNKGIPKK